MKNSNLFINLTCIIPALLIFCTVNLKAQNDLTGYTYLTSYYYHYNDESPHHYYLSNCETTWEEANEAAIEMGGYLATMSSEPENSYLGYAIENFSTYPGAWIGLRVVNGIYEWANGETIMWDFPWVWPAQEPIYANGAALMSHFYLGNSGTLWTSYPVSGEFRYIVEFPFQSNCNNSNKVYVCRNGNTICINVSALQSHLDHGDLEGPCGPCNTNAMQILPDNEAVMEGHDQQTELQLITTPQEGITIAHDRNQLYVYPNPASAEIHVALPEVHKEGTMRILSLAGQEMYSLLLKGEQSIELDLSAYANGLYIVKVQLASGHYHKKIVKL